MRSFFLKLTFLAAGMLLNFSMNAQEKQGQTYVITDKGSVSDVQPYIDALNNSDMKYHRLKNTRNTIVFNTGVTVQLFSATEINANAHPLVLSEYPESFDSSRDIPVFSLGQNNFIMEQHHVNSKYH